MRSIEDFTTRPVFNCSKIKSGISGNSIKQAIGKPGIAGQGEGL
jgi:hypothetical protein